MNNERWISSIGMIFLIGLLLRSPFLIALSMSLAIILILANWWKKHSLDEIIYRRRWQYTRAFPGESYPVKLEIENHKLLPLSWLRIQDPWPKMVGPANEDVLAPSHIPGQGFLTHVFSLRWFERTQRTYALLFRKRGAYMVGPAQLESGDLFGIYSKTRELGQGERLTVFPALVSLEKLNLPPDNPFGDLRSHRRLFEDPNRPIGVREYHPEDGFRRVHWPATARTGQLQVKLFQPTSAQVMVLCLNIATYHRYWEGVYPALLEYLLSSAATLLSMGVENGYRVGMISNGCLGNSDQPFRIPPGQSSQQLSRLLEALAGVTPVVVAPFDRFLLREIPKVPYGASLVILSAVITPGLTETLIRLKRHERRITLISLAESEPPLIPRIHCIHLPFTDQIDPLEMQPL